jgi:hypothetical protein
MLYSSLPVDAGTFSFIGTLVFNKQLGQQANLSNPLYVHP